MNNSNGKITCQFCANKGNSHTSFWYWLMPSTPIFMVSEPADPALDFLHLVAGREKNARWVLHECIACAVQSFHSSLPMTGSILQPKFCRMWPIFRRMHALSSTLAECVPPALFNLCMPLPRQCQTGEYVVVAPHWHNMVRYVMVAWEKFKTRWGQSALIMHVGCLGRTKCDVHSSIVGNFTALRCNLILYFIIKVMSASQSVVQRVLCSNSRLDWCYWWVRILMKMITRILIFLSKRTYYDIIYCQLN